MADYGIESDAPAFKFVGESVERCLGCHGMGTIEVNASVTSPRRVECPDCLGQGYLLKKRWEQVQ